MMQIHTVAAGGGSICRFDGARFRVGPESAGADPGPACYRKGGPLTVTDCNLFLGRIDPAFFPAVFGPPAAISRSTLKQRRVRGWRRSPRACPNEARSKRSPRASCHRRRQHGQCDPQDFGRARA
jgi:N-methylhydantoinase A/oxoprolinase/acetone carboxylase beta subunit